ncbi:MAG TPA: carboxypeptidase regulatory-like domain-containing protein [Pyrinomonadaceae bacterium]|jgi:hypothetical protein
MRTLSHIILAAAILLDAFVIASFAQAAPKETKETKETATITGRVTGGGNDGDQPLPGVGIILTPAGFNRYVRRAAARATTGADGFYRLANVPAGSYQLYILAPGYTPAGALSSRGRGDARTINIEAGETLEHQDFTLARGGVITGRVMDADGKPVIAETLKLLHPGDPRSGAGNVGAAYRDETDDRGVYRLYGLPAGRYLVCLGEEKESGAVRAALMGKNLTRTCYPNATEEAQARIVEVSAGGEVTGVNITLAPPAKTYEVSGRMLDAETGQPVANLSYGFGAISPGDKHIGNRGWNATKTNAAGEFRFGNLPPGRYAVFVVPREQDAPNYYSEALPFEIDDENLNGLVVKVRRGAILRGIASIEGATDRAAHAKLAQVSLHVHVVAAEPRAADELPVGNSSRLVLQPDGSFHVAGLPPGKAQFTLDGFSSPRGFALLRVERGAAEQRDGIEIGVGEQVSDVRLRLAYGTAVVRGQLEVRRDGQPSQIPEGGQLYVTMRRVEGVRASWENVAVEVDGRGRFVLEALAPGEYELKANVWVRPTPTAPLGASIPPVRQNVSVPEKGEVNVTLVYDLSAKPQAVTP